jgi:hypothetical protein
MQGLDNAVAELPNVRGGNMGAFRDFEELDGQEVDGGDFGPLESWEKMLVWFCFEAR